MAPCGRGKRLAVAGIAAAMTHAASAQEGARAFDLPAGPAAHSIDEFARQAGVNVLGAADILAGVTTNAVQGSLTVADGLHRLLDGSGLSGKFYSDKVIFILKAPPGATADQSGLAAAALPVASVTVTGYRASLESSAQEKRRMVGFGESVAAEEFGKFPDQNVAESLARIPGVSIGRDVTGEGMNVQIRGLGSSFTKVLLNNAQIAVASGGPIDSLNYANREVDLDLLPTDLFSRITVSKSQTASMTEGGAAGTVDIRNARPFDDARDQVVVNYRRQKQQAAHDAGQAGSVLASRTWGGTVGLLGGLAFNEQDTRALGFGTIGWTNPNLSAAQNAGELVNNTGGGNYTIPAVVPQGAGAGLVAGTPIDQAFLLAHNPGLSITQIDNALIPRLGRIEDFFGKKRKLSAVLSAEYRPRRDLRLYVDALYSKRHDKMMRIESTWAVRSNAPIPLNLSVDRADCSDGCVVTSGTFANARFFIEDRPYDQKVTLKGANPGMAWQIGPDVKLEAQANWTRSDYRSDAPTVMPITAEGSGMVVSYVNGIVPHIAFSQDVSDPASFGWRGGRVNLSTELRSTATRGLHADLTAGGAALKLKTGIAYDDVDRRIRNLDNTAAWQAAVCGNQPLPYLPSPNDQPPCDGATTPGLAAAALDPGYGSGYTAGQAGTVSYRGSLIPAGSLPGYLVRSPYGGLMIDWDRFRRDSRYDDYAAAAPDAAGNIGGYVRERTGAAYAEVNGELALDGHALRYNAGVRYVRTLQAVGSFNGYIDLRNTATTPSGARYPNLTAWIYRDKDYGNLLPSATAALSLRDNVMARASASRTMTRANPTALRPGVIFNAASADVGSLGNPDLTPYSSDNLDLGLDWFTGREGYASVTAFAKRIKGFTLTENLTLPFRALAQYGVTYETLAVSQKTAIDNRGGPDVATVVMQHERNAGGALDLKGLEIGWVQPLDRWLAVRGFGFNETLTLITQRATGEGANGYVALGVPKKTNTFGLYYESRGWTARIAHSYLGRSQVAAGNQNGIPAAALFNAVYQQVDFSSSVDLQRVLGGEGWPTLSFNVTNLNRAKRRQYFQFENATYSSYDPGPTYQLGIRARF